MGGVFDEQDPEDITGAVVYPAIPKTTGGHLAENFESLDVVLTDEQVERMSGIEERHRCVDPPSAPWD